MYKFYLIIALGVLMASAYFYGAKIADARCETKYFEKLNNNQTQILKHEKEIHEIAYKTSLCDIRRILRDEYSIAE